MQLILKKLKSQSNQKSTVNNYLGIWHRFNDFIMKLNELPKDWEDRVALYVGYMVDQGLQSATIKSYMSATKKYWQMMDINGMTPKFLWAHIQKPEMHEW